MLYQGNLATMVYTYLCTYEVLFLFFVIFECGSLRVFVVRGASCHLNKRAVMYVSICSGKFFGRPLKDSTQFDIGSTHSVQFQDFFPSLNVTAKKGAKNEKLCLGDCALISGSLKAACFSPLGCHRKKAC
jgi:hypothetical protein